MKYVMKLLFVTLFLAFSGCASTSIEVQSDYAPGYEKVANSLSILAIRNMVIHGVPGISIVITDKKDLLYQGNFGYSNYPENIVISDQTEFRIGSITKLFTATAIMQLSELGKLDLDDSITQYVPDFSINNDQNQSASNLTIRALLAHMSGLPTDYQAGFLSYDADTELLSLLSQGYLATEPYTVMSYSNIAYNLLGRAIENVSGLSYEQYVMRFIFEPLEMHTASLGASSNIAAGHSGRQITPFVELRDRAAGDMTMSIQDLAKFARASLNNNAGLMQSHSFDEMVKPQGDNLVFKSNQQQGLGWILGYPSEHLGGVGNIIWHDGSIGSFRSVMLSDLDSGLAVAVVSNSQEGSNAIYDIAEQAMLQAIEHANGDVSQSTELPDWSNEVVPFSQAQLQALPGEYVSNAHGEIEIKRQGNNLIATVAATNIQLQSYSDGLIGADYHLFNLIPLDIDAVNGFRFRLRTYNDQILIEQMGVGIVAEKLTEPQLARVWKARLGQYELQKSDGGIAYKNLRLESYQGILRMYATVTVAGVEAGDVSAFIRPVSNNRAVLIGYGRSLGESLVFDEDGSFSYSGFIFKKLSQ